jgi:signal recognition particle receptor subunit beta
MVLFNYSTRELTAKIVYYGPGLCGKTTNLQFVYSSLPEGVRKGKMLSLATKTDRTLFFDFLPIELGTIRGMRTRVQLYTVPGQVFYNSTRKLVLKGADGVVFVADSQTKMLEADLESYHNLEENLREMGIRIEEIPLVMQFNKRDLPNLSSIEEMNTRINRHNAPFYEAVAMTGIGVEDTLKAITKLVLNNLSAKYKLEEGGRAGAAAPAPSVPGAAPTGMPAPVVARRAPVPALEETEDEAVDALEAAPLPPPRPAPVAPLPRAAAPRPEVIDLVDEILDDEPPAPRRAPAPAPPVTLHPVASRPMAAPQPVAARVGMAAAAALESDPLELDDPIDLDDPFESLSPAASVAVPLAIGPLAAGEEREIEVPVRVDLEGRVLQLHLRLKVRLSR